MNAGGNGSGKTYGLIAILGAFIWPGLAPDCFSAPIFRDNKFPKRIWIVSNPGELGMTGAIQSSIDELWPKKKYTASKNGRQYNSVFRSDTGWEIELKSTEQSITEFRGANVGLVALNEPLPEDIFRETLARTRRGGLIIGAMTSLDDQPWIVDGLLEKHNGKDYRIVYGGVEDNCKDHTPGGTLSHEIIERILSKYPEDEQEARRTGKPLSLSGRIFKTFDRAVHVIPECRPPADTAVYMSVDPAGGKPFACVWAYADAGGNVTIFDEWPNYEFFNAKDPGLTIGDYADIFRTKEAGLSVVVRILDRHYGNTRHKPGATTLREDFGVHGFDFVDSYSVGEDKPEVQTGILRVMDYLRYDKTKTIDGANKPMLHITANCRNTIESLSRWTRDPKTLKPKDDHYKDFSDVTRYLVMSRPVYEPEREWKEPIGPHFGVNNG